jgi:hypothetical protein
MAEGAGNALSVDLILFPELVRIGMATLTFRRIRRRVADEDENKIDGKKYSCHPNTDQPRLLG